MSALLPDGRISLYAHYTTSLSALYAHMYIWKYWISKTLVRYVLSSICLRLSQYPQLSFMQCCVHSAYTFLLWWLWGYVYFVLSSEVCTICHCFGLDHETLVGAVYLSMFLWFSSPFIGHQGTINHYSPLCFHKHTSCFNSFHIKANRAVISKCYVVLSCRTWVELLSQFPQFPHFLSFFL